MDKEIHKPRNIDGHYYNAIRGVSMWPLIKTPDCAVNIVPVDRELKKYDVALYHRDSIFCIVFLRWRMITTFFMGITAGVRRLFLRIRLSALLLSITAKAGGLMLMIYVLRYMHIYGAMRCQCVVRF